MRALILTPTRELAAQVEESVRTYGKYLPLTSTVVFGGVNIGPQIETLRRGVDILIATPGRLLDHVGQGTVDLGRVEILVLDEADRMLDMGFIRDIRKVLALLPARRQNLLFSATFTDDIRALADGLLHDPVRVEVARRNAESELVTPGRLRRRQGRQARPARASAPNARKSRRRWSSRAPSTARTASPSNLAKPTSPPPPSTATAASRSGRGRWRTSRPGPSASWSPPTSPRAAWTLTSSRTSSTLNCPMSPEDYVHRIGRTGRAGSLGDALSLVCAEEQADLKAIEKLLGRPIARRTAPGFVPPPPAAVQTQVATPAQRTPAHAPPPVPSRAAAEAPSGVKLQAMLDPALKLPGGLMAPEVWGATNKSSCPVFNQWDLSQRTGTLKEQTMNLFKQIWRMIKMMRRAGGVRGVARLAQDGPKYFTLFRRLLADPRVPVLAKALLVGGIAFAVSPLNLPQFIPVVGALDDIGIVLFVGNFLLKQTPPDVLAEHRRRSA